MEKLKPKESDYVLTYQADGETFIFEDFTAEYYMPANSLILVKDGTVKSFVSKKMIQLMNEEGLKRTSKETRQMADKIENGIKECRKEFEEILSHKIQIEDIKKAFEIFSALYGQYAYFDYAFWDKSYEKAESDPNIKENVELVQDSKNKLRDGLNDVFFSGGYMVKLLDSLGQQIDVKEEDLEFYSIKEIYSIFDGKKITQEKIDERKKAYVMYKGEDFIVDLLEGKQAEDFISDFFDKQKNTIKDIIKGQTAHKTGQVIRARVRNITRDYTNTERVREEMQEMQKGEVLVSQTTDPEMMPAIIKASAIVVDIGGMLSHSAIVARELNIPCIVNTRSASVILKTGDLVEVDAERGTIKIIE